MEAKLNGQINMENRNPFRRPISMVSNKLIEE
jgi:hypothetical protein